MSIFTSRETLAQAEADYWRKRATVAFTQLSTATNLLGEAQRNADAAEIEAAHWRTTATLAQGRLDRLTKDHRQKAQS